MHLPIQRDSSVRPQPVDLGFWQAGRHLLWQCSIADAAALATTTPTQTFRLLKQTFVLGMDKTWLAFKVSK